ncbi:glycosyltransferase family 2 protein [Larkinella punicea]|uniref:Glycosyltransferase family 2 protein n=1 Tax=Larkinella punicea TaxID=2315727 RepID=A0A368JT44_9BACT|nr:glycosyltransferase family 2 protein [Larkinella punicea]RCR69773.1 glycosyltransferase family 2 protein [Larkinella punicea]
MKIPVKAPLSVVIITLNAERTLKLALESVVEWVDEVIVVDSGSTDATLTIASDFNCRVTYRKFNGFGPQKQYAIDQAKNDWVLVLDADEIVTEQLANEIAALFVGEPIHAGYTLPRNLIFLGRILRHSGQNRQPVLRLFNRHHGRMTPVPVHESVQVEGSIGQLSGILIHYSYGSLHDYVLKMNHYTTLSAEEMALRHKKANIPLQGLRFLFTFLKIYFFKGGLLDGYPGFVWALLSAIYPVIKYSKLQELHDNDEKPKTKPVLAFGQTPGFR